MSEAAMDNAAAGECSDLQSKQAAMDNRNVSTRKKVPRDSLTQQADLHFTTSPVESPDLTSMKSRAARKAPTISAITYSMHEKLPATATFDMYMKMATAGLKQPPEIAPAL
mmetsp:Transcript_11370/g.20456  ORF Transcript_11370/g.20456 Transcript_11370/m.20456 type:complete len:111 (-) Transcript_11370:117-449(-)